MYQCSYLLIIDLGSRFVQLRISTSAGLGPVNTLENAPTLTDFVSIVRISSLYGDSVDLRDVSQVVNANRQMPRQQGQIMVRDRIVATAA